MDELHGASIFTRRVLRTILIASIAIVVLCLAWFQAQVLFLLLAGVLFAIALHGASAWVAARTKLPHKVAVGALVLVMLGLVALGAWLIGPDLAEQARKLAREIPRAYDAIVAEAQSLPWIRPLVGGQPTNAAPPAEPKAIVEGATNLMSALMEGAGAMGVVFFLGVYGAADPEAYTRPILALVPPSRRARVDEVMGIIGSNLARWLLGRAVAMLFVGVSIAIAMSVLKVPLALSLGILAGLLTFIEYVGAIASAIPVALVALSRGPLYVVWVLAIFTVIHVIEGYVLTPLLARTTVRFPPAYTLAAQVVLGAMFGAMGLTFATPLGVIVILLVQKLYVEDILGDVPMGEEARVAATPFAARWLWRRRHGRAHASSHS
jgi:predicted PurR-regulated permease PerM